jgi:DNA polymerase III delta subunit
MPAHFLTATDDLLLREQVEAIAAGIPLDVFSAHEIALADFTRDALSASLFSEQRAVWLQEVQAFPTGKKTISLLTDMCHRLPSEMVLVLSQNIFFEGDYRKAASFKSGALQKALATVCQHREISLKGRALNEWVRSRALNEYQIELSESQVQFLLDACMQMPSLADAELRKFALLKRPGAAAAIADETFRTVLTRTPGQNVRDLVDTALSRDSKALTMTVDLYRHHDGGPLLFTELYRGCERLLAILTDPQYASRAFFKNLHPFVQRKLAGAAHRWQAEELLRNLTFITDAEFRLRTNRTMGRTTAEAERNLVLVLLKQMFGK